MIRDVAKGLVFILMESNIKDSGCKICSMEKVN